MAAQPPASASDVAGWLHALGLERYQQIFQDNDIDGEVLADLDDADLEKLGVSLGHRKKLLKAIAALGPPASAPSQEAAAPPAVEGERRQVTVLFADLVGFTRLTHELGAEAMHDITDRFFALADEVIADFGGTIDKHIGDCVMAVFGAPVAHHNDPERAVRAALAIRDAMPDLSSAFGSDLDTHIGIASGQVVASTGAGHKSYSITGGSVNLASRLSDQAAAGTIMVSEAVRRLLADRLECVEVEPLTLKGLDGPVRAFHVIGLHEAAPRERPFVGRRAELQQLDGVLRACLAHGRGQAVHIRGEAGIGKTRLLEEVQREAAGAGFACHKGLVLDFGAIAGQDAVGSLLRGLLGLTATDDAAAAVAAIDAALREGLTTADRRVFLHDLLGLPQPGDLRALYDAMDNRARIQGQQDTLALLVERASLQTPQLLIVEDVHWADRPTQGQLARLARAVAAARVVLIMTTRLEGDPLDDVWRSSAGGSPLLTLDLGPLGDDDASHFAEAYVDASTELARRCIARAAGNPLFLDQLLRHAEESVEEGVPASVQSLVQARLDHLTPADRQALQAASVLGQRFTADALGHLLGEPTHDCASLVRHLLLRAIGDEYLFAHALIRDGVYDSLLTSRRAALHLRAAAWFATRDPILHAEHLDRAQDAAAPDAYLEAARRQMAIYRYDAADALIRRGLAIARSKERTFALTCLRGDILHDLGVMAEAGAAYAAALDVAGDDGQRCRAWLGLAAVKRVTDDLDGAFADLERAEAAAQAQGLKEQLARICYLRGNLHFPRGQIDACLEQHNKTLAFAQEIGASDLEAAALGGLGDAEYARGRMLTSGGYFERCIAICRQHGFGRIEVPNLPMAATTRFFAGDIAGAHADALAAVRAAECVGHDRAVMIGCHIVHFTAVARGEPATARTYVDRALALSRQLGARRFEAEALWFLGEILRTEGRRPDAVDAIRQALAISRETGMAYIGPSILGALAHTTDRDEERRAALVEAQELLAAGSVSHNYIWFYQDAIETSLAQRDWADVERYARALADYTRAEPLSYTDAFIERARALAAFGRNPHHPDTMHAVQTARRHVEKIGWINGLPALDAALATLTSATRSPCSPRPTGSR